MQWAAPHVPKQELPHEKTLNQLRDSALCALPYDAAAYRIAHSLGWSNDRSPTKVRARHQRLVVRPASEHVRAGVLLTAI